MKYSTVLNRLQNLIKITPSVSDIARITGLKEKSVYARRTLDREFSEEEIKKLEDYFGVSLYSRITNTMKRYYNTNTDMKAELQKCGSRITEIQAANNLSSRQMAGLLDISEKDLACILSGEKLPDFNVLSNLKQNFQVSMDWLLYGV